MRDEKSRDVDLIDGKFSGAGLIDAARKSLKRTPNRKMSPEEIKFFHYISTRAEINPSVLDEPDLNLIAEIKSRIRTLRDQTQITHGEWTWLEIIAKRLKIPIEGA